MYADWDITNAETNYAAFNPAGSYGYVRNETSNTWAGMKVIGAQFAKSS